MLPTATTNSSAKIAAWTLQIIGAGAMIAMGALPKLTGQFPSPVMFEQLGVEPTTRSPLEINNEDPDKGAVPYTPGDAARGKELYTTCVACHGPAAAGWQRAASSGGEAGGDR